MKPNRTLLALFLTFQFFAVMSACILSTDCLDTVNPHPAMIEQAGICG
jgi:hypothetical protein